MLLSYSFYIRTMKLLKKKTNEIYNACIYKYIYMRDMALVACTQWVKSGKIVHFFREIIFTKFFHEIDFTEKKM